MELLGYVDVPLWVFLLIACVFLVYRYSVHPFSIWKEHGVDGPKPIPFMGNASQLYNLKVGIRACLKKWEAKYGRVFGVFYMRRPALVVTDLDMLKKIFVKDFNNFSDRYQFGEGNLTNRIVRKGLFFEYGNDWHRIRRIMTPTFTSGKLKLLVHHINKTALHLSENFQKNAMEKRSVDAKAFFGAFSLDVIAGLAFSLDVDSLSSFDVPFIKNAKALMTFKTLTRIKVILGGIFPQLAQLFKLFGVGFFDSDACNYFENFIDSLISKRKNDAKGETSVDFLQLLLNAEAEDDGSLTERKMTSEEVAAQCIIFIIAGYETTSSVLQFLAYELGRNMSIQEKVLREIQDVIGDVDQPTPEQLSNLKYMSAVISEALRMYPPLHLLMRQAEKACEINGVSIPAKAAIMIPLYNIGRDPEYFEEPDVFKPERFLGQESQTLHDISFLPFGFGPRHCIGMRLALMQMKLALVHLLRKVVIHDVTPEVPGIEDFSGILVAEPPIKLSVGLR